MTKPTAILRATTTSEENYKPQNKQTQREITKPKVTQNIIYIWKSSSVIQ